MPHGVKTPKPKEYDIMVSYAITNSYRATARDLGVSDMCVKDVINRNYDEFLKIQAEKKEDFINRSNRIIDKMTNLLDRRVSRALEKEDDIDNIIEEVWSASENKEDEGSISRQEKLELTKKLNKLMLNSMSEITTSMGTIYDKINKVSESGETSTPIVEVKVVDNSHLEKVMYEANKHNENDDRQ